MRMETISEFEKHLRESMITFIASARKQGTVGMTEACLKQCLPSPPTSLPGAPRGTNKIWLYGEMFTEAISSLPPQYREFIYS